MLLALDDKVESRRGASQAAINRLGTLRGQQAGAGGADGGGEEAAAPHDDCAVCLEACGEGETLRRLPCRHTFHRNCIDTWLRTKAVCPICQRQAV